MKLCKSIAWLRQSKTNTFDDKNVSHMKNWNAGTVKMHADTYPILMIKSKNNDKKDKDSVKIKVLS